MKSVWRLLSNSSAFVIFFLFVASTYAQNRDTESPISLLPEASSGAPARIDLTNAQEFRSLIVPELYQALRSGTLELYALRKLDDEPSAVIGLSEENALNHNAHALLESGLVDLDFRLYSLKEATMVRQFAGRLVRVNPKALNPQDRTSQSFREIIRFTVPTSIAGFTWLTFRFSGEDPDLLWLFSPANNKGRELTGSNRSDGMLRTSLSPNDIFGWSSKSALVAKESSSEVEAFVIFLDAKSHALQNNGDCRALSRDAGVEGEGESDDAVHWNFGGRRVPRAAGWLPLDVVAVPRRLYRYELESRDPYSLYGRQILYLDAVSGAPVYKFVFDRAGKPWKTIISGLGMFNQANGIIGVYSAFSVVDDFRSSEPAIFDVSRIAFCNRFPPGLTLSDFDPRHFGEWNMPVEAATPTPEATPVAEG